MLLLCVLLSHYCVERQLSLGFHDSLVKRSQVQEQLIRGELKLLEVSAQIFSAYSVQYFDRNDENRFNCLLLE